MHGMTPARARVLQALRDLTCDGWPATVEEVAGRVGFASKSTAQAHLHGLRHDGYAEQHPRNSKGGWKPTPA